MCDDDLKALIIEGEPTADELSSAWDTIYGEYISLSSDAANKRSLILAFEIESLKAKITVVDACVSVLRTYRMDDLVKTLHELGFRFPFNDKDIEAYHKDLDRVLSRSKTFSLQLEQKEEEQKRTNEGSKGGKITREYFEEVLITLSDHAKFQLTENSLTVAEFCRRLNRYVKYCEQVNAKTGAKRSNR